MVDNEPTYIRQLKQYESRQTGPREHVRMFLEHFFSDDLGHVEIMPFHDGNNETFKKHLPPWMTKICVYYYYKSWAEDDNAILRDLATESEVKLASFDTFRQTWKEDFPDVTTPKVKRFSHCPICAAGKALRDQAREICTKDMTPEERQVHRQHQQLVRRQVRAEQKVHLERVRQERRDLNNAVFQSRLGHGNFLFFEIDSMDSAKTLLPHWVRIPKTVKPDMLLKYHLTCVKYDGYRPDDIYYYTNTIPHDSSTTCTLIWITIIKAFSPTPEIVELSFSLDFSEWLRPHFQDHIQDINKPHKFEFTRDDAAASGGSLRTALWSNTPLSEPVQILKSAPTGTPEIRAGRPLLYALCDKKKPDAVKVHRYLDDFKKVMSYITDLAVQWHFSPVERESWKNLLDDLDEKQTAPSAAFSRFWPQRKEEVDDLLREHGQTAPVEARHTMATNADLNNAEAARVEAEVRAQVLQDDSAFRRVHAGAKERLHDNTSPSDAKGSNLVVIDVSDTKGGKKPVDTSWEKCLTLPWKLVEAVPLSYAKAIHDASGSREVFNEDGTMVRKKCGTLSTQMAAIKLCQSMMMHYLVGQPTMTFPQMSALRKMLSGSLSATGGAAEHGLLGIGQIPTHPCLAPVVGSHIILPSKEHNRVTVDLYGDTLMNLSAHGDDHRDELKDLMPDAEKLSLLAFDVVTESYDSQSLKPTLLESGTTRYGVKCTAVPRATAVDRFERSLLGDTQRGLAARDAAWHNTELGQKGPLRDILDMSEYMSMVFGTVGPRPEHPPALDKETLSCEEDGRGGMGRRPL
eukprot:jgi/Tetstr1/461620/TSEL_006720.t1